MQKHSRGERCLTGTVWDSADCCGLRRLLACGKCVQKRKIVVVTHDQLCVNGLLKIKKHSFFLMFFSVFFCFFYVFFFFSVKNHVRSNPCRSDPLLSLSEKESAHTHTHTYWNSDRTHAREIKYQTILQ